MATSIVGLDFSKSRIRAVELKIAGKARPTIVRYGEVAVPEDAIKDGEVIEPHTVSSSLKRLWSSAGFKTKDIALGISSQRVIVRDLAVPRLPLKQIKEALPFHVQDLLPFPSTEAILDFYPISEGVSNTGPTVNGLLVAALKSAVSSNVTAVRLAGLTPLSVDLTPFALSRLLVTGAYAQQTVAILDLGAQTTSILIAAGGIPQFVRIIPNGGDTVTDALQKRMELSLADANQVKRTVGVARGNTAAEYQQAVEIIYETTSTLIMSIRNTLNYYSNARPGAGIDHIIALGGGSQLPGLLEAIAELTKIPVTRADPFLSVQFDRHATQSLQSVNPLDVIVPLALARKAGVA